MKAIAAVVVSLLLWSHVNAQSSTIIVPVVLGGGERVIYSQHGEPNGMPCWWYEYAVYVGLDWCDHPGIDVDAQFEPLYAATDGVIEFAGWDSVYWPAHVDIRVTGKKFKGELHIYGHLSAFYVAPGDVVRRGDLIGVTGTAGSGPHLHFERRSEPNERCLAGCSLDPVPVLTWKKKK